MRANIDVWSDYVCPFCYLADPTVQRLRAERGGSVEIRWRAFELRPDPAPTLDPKGDYLRDIWEQAVFPMARRRGMTLKLPPVQPRSRLAHEATAFARAKGLADEMHYAIFQAFFERGEDIGKPSVLAGLATEIGLGALELTDALTAGTYAAAVQADQEIAHNLDLSGVPAFVVRGEGAPWENAVIVEGAQPFAAIDEIVARALETHSGSTARRPWGG